MVLEWSPRLLTACPGSLHTASDGLIWPMAGYASIAYRNGGPSTFFPFRSRRIPRETTKSPARHPPLRYGRKRCGAIALGL
jgi:hypothetical protein